MHPPRTVVALAGRRIDAAETSPARFPLAHVPAVRAALRQLLVERGVVALVASAACGADLIALEVAGQLGLRRRVILPFAPERFRATSVVDRPGDWAGLYERVLADAEARGDVEVLVPAASDEAAYAAVTLRLVEEAARLATEAAATPLVVAVWEGRARPQGTDETQALVEAAAARGIAAVTIVSRPPLEASIERGWREVAAVDEAHARGAIDDAGWYERMGALMVPAYLRGDNPRAQSGYTGDAAAWEQARSLVAEAIPRPGGFLDVGCASGLLMESVRSWCAARGLEVEPYGLDIAPELAALARARLPHWAERVFEGNALDWQPPRRFDFVRTGLDYVPAPRRPQLVAHLLAEVVAPGGRLLLGPYTEERDETRRTPSQEALVSGWGFRVSGRIERPHPRDERVVRRLIFVD